MKLNFNSPIQVSHSTFLPAIKHLPHKQFRCYTKPVRRKIVTMCRIKSERNVVYGLDDTTLRCLDRNITKAFK